MGEVVFGIDFRNRKRRSLQSELSELARTVVAELKEAERILYASPPCIAPDKDPA